ncbi:MAG: hypothetical protein JXQ96_22475 [Cyclobacteriaceae bacterium]
MFGFFKSKLKGPQLTYFVYLNQTALYRQLFNRLIREINSGGRILVVYYFSKTLEELKMLIEAGKLDYSMVGNNVDVTAKLYLASESEVLNSQSSGLNLEMFSVVIFSEIHPMAGRDLALHEHLQQYNKEAYEVFYTSMDSPIIQPFGAERIINIMKKLGMDENEMIEHDMVTQSLIKAQEKISAAVRHEKPADSAELWMSLNAGGLMTE